MARVIGGTIRLAVWCVVMLALVFVVAAVHGLRSTGAAVRRRRNRNFLS